MVSTLLRYVFKLKPKLKNLFWDITYVCNLRCKHCFYWNPKIASITLSRLRSYGRELTFSEIKEYIVPKLIRANIRCIVLTGGEPLVREDVWEVLRLLHKHYFTIVLYTNATLIDSKFKSRILVSSCSGIQISLDGPEDVNDEIRGVGTFKRVIRALHLIDEAMNELHRKVNIVINCVINRYNMHALSDLVSALKDFNIVISYQFLEWKDSVIETNGWIQPIGEDLRKVDPDVVYRECKKAVELGKKYGIKIRFHPLSWPFNKNDIEKWFYDPKYRPSNHCLFLWDSIRLDPYGNIYPCMYINKTLGNIKIRDVNECFLSEEMDRLRRSIRGRPLDLCNKCCKLIRRPYDRVLDLVIKYLN